METCADCGGFDVEWMYKCQKHGTWRCRGCSCPWCDEDAQDDYDYDREGEVNMGNKSQIGLDTL